MTGLSERCLGACLGDGLRGEAFLPLPRGEGDLFLIRGRGDDRGDRFRPLGDRELFLSLLGDGLDSLLSLRDSLDLEESMSFLPLGGDPPLFLLLALGLCEDLLLGRVSAVRLDNFVFSGLSDRFF